MSTVTKIRVVYRDMPGELSYEATVQAAILCEVCADEGVPGVTETTTGLSVCHPCFYGQVAEGMVAVIGCVRTAECLMECGRPSAEGDDLCRPCRAQMTAQQADDRDGECAHDGCDSDSIPMSEFCLAHDPESAQRL